MGKMAALSALLIALLALAAPPFAGATTLDEEEVAIPAEAPIEGFTTAWELTTTGGSIECGYNFLEGSLVSNGGEAAVVEIASAAFTHSESVVPCNTTIAGGAMKMDVTPLKLPWVIKFGPKGIGNFSSVGFKLTATLSGVDVATCVYETKAMEARYGYDEPLTDQVPIGERLSLNAGASKGECPETLGAHGTFLFRTGGNGIVATE